MPRGTEEQKIGNLCSKEASTFEKIPQQTNKRTDRRKGMTGKHGKVGKEKVVGFSSASIFPARKREAVTQGGAI